MLSTLVLLADSDGPPASLGALVRTLGALVPGTIEGLVRDVTIVAAGPDPEVGRVADHAGCALVDGPGFERAMAAALAGLRAPITLLLRAGAHVDRDFRDEVARALSEAAGGVSLLLREVPTGLAGRVLPGLAPIAGLVAPARMLRPARSFNDLVKQAGKARTLTARAVMVA